MRSRDRPQSQLTRGATTRAKPHQHSSGTAAQVRALARLGGNQAMARLVAGRGGGRARPGLGEAPRHAVQRATKVKVPGRRGALAIDLLTDSDLEGLIKELETPTVGTQWQITYDNETSQELLARAKKKLASRQKVTGKFNVRGRAEDVQRGVVFSDALEVRELAADLGLGAYLAEKEPLVRQIYPNDFNNLTLVVDQPAYFNTKLYAPASMARGPREDAASLKGTETLPDPPNANPYRTKALTLTGPCRRGDESQSKNKAMGGYTARNYAKAVGIQEAHQHTWEWLHLVGAGIGGANELGNLVAGTYDMNTMMIPLEQTIVEYSSRPDVDENNPMQVWAEVKVFERDNEKTWVAETIRLVVQHKGETMYVGPIGVTTVKMTKFEFDFYRWIFQKMAKNA